MRSYGKDTDRYRSDIIIELGFNHGDNCKLTVVNGKDADSRIIDENTARRMFRQQLPKSNGKVSSINYKGYSDKQSEAGEYKDQMTLKYRLNVPHYCDFLYKEGLRNTKLRVVVPENRYIDDRDPFVNDVRLRMKDAKTRISANINRMIKIRKGLAGAGFVIVASTGMGKLIYDAFSGQNEAGNHGYAPGTEPPSFEERVNEGIANFNDEVVSMDEVNRSLGKS